MFKCKLPLFLFLLFILGSCGEDAEYEELSMPSELLTQDRHPYGWQREDCYSCHVDGNVHRYNSLNKSEEHMNLARSSKTLYGSDGNIGCTTCHGNNGVE